MTLHDLPEEIRTDLLLQPTIYLNRRIYYRCGCESEVTASEMTVICDWHDGLLRKHEERP